MPHSDLHKKKLWKNIAVLAAVFFFCAVLWGITMIKVAEW